MTSRRRGALLVIAFVVLSLVACWPGAAPSPAPTPTPTHTSSSPRPSPSPSVSETPEPVAASPGVARVPIGCDELVDSRVQAGAMGVPEEEISPRATQPVYSVNDAAAVQAGLLTCSWERSRVGLQPGEFASMRIQILPDAGSAFHAHSRAHQRFYVPDPDYYPELMVGLTGEDSYFTCDSYQYGRSCDGALETAGYWVEFSFSGPLPSTAEDENAAQLATSVGDAVRLALDEAGPPHAPFSPPSGSATAWDSCVALEGAGALQRATKSSTLTFRPEYDGPPLYQSVFARMQPPFATCFWNQSAYPEFDYDEYYYSGCDECRWYDYDEVESRIVFDDIESITISVLPGGEWAWQELKAHETPLDAESLARLGVPEATYSSGWGYWTYFQVLVDHSIVEVQFNYWEGSPDTLDSKARALTIMHYVLSQLGE